MTSGSCAIPGEWTEWFSKDSCGILFRIVEKGRDALAVAASVSDDLRSQSDTQSMACCVVLSQRILCFSFDSFDSWRGLGRRVALLTPS